LLAQSPSAPRKSVKKSPNEALAAKTSAALANRPSLRH